MAKKKTPNFLAGLKKGALHEELGVAKGKKIPASKLVIKKGMSAKEKKRINFAKVAKKWHHGRKKMPMNFKRPPTQ